MSGLEEMQSERKKAFAALEEMQESIKNMDKIAREGDWGEGDINNLHYAYKHLQIADRFIQGVRRNPGQVQIVNEDRAQ